MMRALVLVAVLLLAGCLGGTPAAERELAGAPAGSAMQAYPVARAAALAWNDDASLREMSAGGLEPLTGTAGAWTFEFGVAGTRDGFKARVEGDRLVASGPYSRPKEFMPYDARPAPALALLDSVAAATAMTGSEGGRALWGESPPMALMSLAYESAWSWAAMSQSPDGKTVMARAGWSEEHGWVGTANRWM